MVDYDLVGAWGSPGYACNDITEVARDTGFCWSGWTNPISQERIRELKQSRFRVLVYGGKGRIQHIFHCEGLEYDKNGRNTPDRNHTFVAERDQTFRAWLKVHGVKEVSIDISTTRKLSDDKPVRPQGLQKCFAYVYRIQIKD